MHDRWLFLIYGRVCLFLKPLSHLILCTVPADVIHSHPTAGGRAKLGTRHGSAAEQGGHEGSFALRTAILIFAAAGNSSKLKPDADASSYTPALTVKRVLGKGSKNPAGSMGPHQLGNSYYSDHFSEGLGAVNR